MAKILYFFFLLLVTMMTALKMSAEAQAKMDKYEWLPTESAYENFPMRIIKGYLVFEDGTSIYIPSSKVINNGWGELGSTHIVGEKYKPIPMRLDILWFSYTENKFYSGIFTLPFENIRQLFKVGLQSPVTGKKITFQEIIVGVAPAGEISIWLMADGEVLLVANFRANETTMDWKLITEKVEISRCDFIKRILDRSLSKEQASELTQHGIPYVKLKAHRVQYSWTPEVTGSKPVNLWLKTYNGECEFIDFINNSHEPRHLRAVPKHFRIEWKDTIGKIFVGDVTFDENEAMRAYQKLSTGKTDHALKLELEINEKKPSIQISLRDSKFIYRFEKSVVKIFLK